MQHIPTTPPDMTAALIPIIQGGLPNGATAGRVYDGSGRFVMVRADLQGPATPITRYCRVGLTVWAVDQGRARPDIAFDLSMQAAATITPVNPLIVDADWQSGPSITHDPTSGLEVQYTTLLLEVVTA